MAKSRILDFEVVEDFLKLEEDGELEKKYNKCPILRPTGYLSSYMKEHMTNCLSDPLLTKCYEELAKYDDFSTKVPISEIEPLEEYLKKQKKMIQGSSGHLDQLWKVSETLKDLVDSTSETLMEMCN